MKSNKGTIGTTITWMVAFVIILLIMILFLIFTGILAGKKSVPIIGDGRSEIEIPKSMDNPETQRKLLYLLNAPLDDDSTIKELIINWNLTGNSEIKDKIIANTKIILEEKKENCYLFKVNGAFLYTHDKMGLEEWSGSSEIYILLNGQKINTKLYFKQC